MSRTRLLRFAVVAVAAIALVAIACGDDDDGGDTLDTVIDRGELKCGVKETQPGFGFLNTDGTHAGNDIEFCRAVAAAVLGDADAVEFVLASAGDRFELLASGEIDVLIRTTTWTASRDAEQAGDFVTTTFYDGQGMMVRSDSGISSLADLEGATICVTSGTTTEGNLDDQFLARGIAYTPLSFGDDAEIQAAFIEGRCDGWTADKSNLAGQRTNFPEGEGGPDGADEDRRGSVLRSLGCEHQGTIGSRRRIRQCPWGVPRLVSKCSAFIFRIPVQYWFDPFGG